MFEQFSLRNKNNHMLNGNGVHRGYNASLVSNANVAAQVSGILGYVASTRFGFEEPSFVLRRQFDDTCCLFLEVCLASWELERLCLLH